jgi:hypothetical protein
MDGMTGQEWKCTCKLVDWLLIDDILLLELLLWDREIKLELWRRRITFCWPLLPVEKTGLCNTGMQLASKEDRQAAQVYVLTQRQQIFPTDRLILQTISHGSKNEVYVQYIPQIQTRQYFAILHINHLLTEQINSIIPYKIMK